MSKYNAASRLNVLTIVVFVVTSIFSYEASAFKLGTHIWVAEQVWNDVNADGSVNIPPFGEIPVSSDVVNALINHKNIYLSGSIGPDGFPDMIGGQMTTHPGTVGGWNSDQWARWLWDNMPINGGVERNMAMAFTYGYFSHLSADVFAHSYVNTYAGDTYELFDNETTVEKRHMLIEAYIDKHTPISSPQTKIAVGDSLPLDWLARTLVMNPAVEAQYSINGANGNSTLHLYLMHEYEDKIDQLINFAEDAQNPLDAKIYELAQWVDENVPPELLNPAHAALSAGNSLCGELIANGGNEGLIDWVFPTYSLANGGSNNNPVLSNADQIIEQLGSAVEDGIKAAIDVVGDNPALCLLHTACIANYALTEAIQRAPDFAICLVANPNACINIWFAEQYCEVSADIVEKHEEFVRQNTYGAAILFMKDQYLGAIIHYLHEWKKTMLPAAKSWTSLSSEIVSGVMQQESPVGKVFDWLECWGFVYAGATSQIQTLCEDANNLFNAVRVLYDKFNDAKQKLDFATLNLVGINAQHIIDDVESEIGNLTDRAQDFAVEKLVPPELRDVIDATLSGVTAASLNEEFAVDNTKYTLNEKHLIEVPRMAERMDKEMHVKQVGGVRQFTFDRFPPVYNAVILSKLSLLNTDQLNELARRAGMTRNLYQAGYSDNILFNAIKSIDGNHQWLAKAPPYPRQDIAPDPEGGSHYYGYPLSQTHGFRIYQDSEARNKIFNRIFKGLLAAGIEKPSTISESKVLPDSYRYRPCVSVPYPNGVGDQSCAIEYLVPILQLLL